MRDYTCLDGMIGNAESMLKAAYEKGYQQGVSDNAKNDKENAKEIRDVAYKYGVRLMFDAMYKIMELPECGGMSVSDLENVFGTCSLYNIAKTFRENPQGIIDNINEFEKSKGLVCDLMNTKCVMEGNCEHCIIKKAYERGKENG